MQRREFLWTSVALAAGTLWPADRAGAAFNPSPADGWRTFEVTHRVDVLQAEGTTRVWLPLPSVQEEDWIRNMGNLWQGNALTARLLRNPQYGAEMLYAEWAPAERPVLEVTSRFATRDRAVDLARPGKAAPLSRADRRLYTRATKLLPTDGIVRRPRSTSRAAPGPTTTRRARSTSGWSTTPSAIRRRAAAASATSAPCWSTGDLSRQVRRPQRALRRPGARGRPAGARRLRHPGGGLALRLQEPGQERRHQPRRSTAAPRCG